jgi:hypothetical protein
MRPTEVAKLNRSRTGRKPEEVMKSSKQMVAVAMLAAMMVVGAVSAHADLAPRKRNVYFESASDVLARKRTVYFEGASDLFRKRSVYFEGAIQIVIRHRDEWFAKASNMVRRPQ